jgi:hypothetical protein
MRSSIVCTVHHILLGERMGTDQHWWEDNIKMELKEIGFGVVD